MWSRERFRRRTRNAVARIVLPALGAMSVAVLPAPPAQAANAAYVMAYFAETPSAPSGPGNVYALHLAVSTDGRQWMPLNQNRPVLTPTLGTRGLRDPFILRKQDGTFVIIASDLYGSNFNVFGGNIHVWTSPDLRTFSANRLLHVNSNSNSTTWAPEAFWDPGRQQYGILFTGTPVGGSRRGIQVAYTTDFVTASASQPFYNDASNTVIDPTIVAGIDGWNYLYVRRGNGIAGLRSRSLNPGSFSIYTGSIAPPGLPLEAPQLVKSLTSNTWSLWGNTWEPDNCEQHVYSTNDIASGSWTSISKLNYTQPLNSNHVGIVPITSTEYDNLVARWATPTWNRIKSMNYPDSVIRHQNHVGRISPYPFDPFADSQFRIRPGLANSTAPNVSLESVNYPGRFLRNSGGRLVLAANDGTNAFATSATFARVPGLANSTLTSFRSYADSSRYVRHHNQQLYVEPASGSPSTADATFQITY